MTEQGCGCAPVFFVNKHFYMENKENLCKMHNKFCVFRTEKI